MELVVNGSDRNNREIGSSATSSSAYQHCCSLGWSCADWFFGSCLDEWHCIGEDCGDLNCGAHSCGIVFSCGQY